jgi:hypothetical protein
MILDRCGKIFGFLAHITVRVRIVVVEPQGLVLWERTTALVEYVTTPIAPLKSATASKA